MRVLATILLFASLQTGAQDTRDVWPRGGERSGMEEGASSSFAAQLGSVQVLRKPATDGGEDRWSVVATRAPLGRLLSTIGSKSGDRIEGVGNLDRVYLITVDLRDRPLPQILEYLLGSVGLDFSLRQNTITVLTPSDFVTREEILAQASVAWIRATSRFPDDPSAPLARLAQGELLEIDGNLGAALFQYQMLIESFPASPLVDDAYMRSGRILQKEGRWGEAMGQFTDLVEFGNDLGYQPAARLEIARCRVELGDPQSAIYIVETLNSSYPTISVVERAGRLLVRASALNALGRYREALDELDAASPDLDPMTNREAMKVRAVCLEGLQEYNLASRAWLTYGRSASPKEKEAALRQAARLALLSPGEEAAVFFICKEAEAIPATRSFDEFKEEAERRLGIRPEKAPVITNHKDRIALAEGWLDSGDVDKASREFEILFLTRPSLEDDEQRARVCVGWARCEEQHRGLEAAIQILAEARSGFETQVARSLLDLGAAALLEKHELYDRAVDAYGGNY